MVDARLARLALHGAVGRQTQVDEGEAVVLVIVGQESEPGVPVLDARLEDAGIPVDHLLEAVRVVNDMGEFTGCDHFCLPGCAGVRGGPVRP